MQRSIIRGNRAVGSLVPIVLTTAGALLALFVGTAQAEIEFLNSFGGGTAAGATAGRVNRPSGIAINNSTEDVYVADRNNHRVQQFTSTGSFVRAWGFDVISSGPHNVPSLDEVQKVSIMATSGTFTLSFGAEHDGRPSV